MTDPVDALIESNRRLWAGEANVFRAYWRWGQRTVDLDLQWLARQCHKELFDGVVPRLTAIRDHLAAGRRDVAGLLTEAEEEFAHLRLFAQVFEELAPDGQGSLSVEDLRDRWRWPENDDLGALRERHRRDHGALGAHASRLTEGGGATLYAEGARLQHDTKADGLIAAACQAVHTDEVRHMLDGVDALRDELSTEDWDRLIELTNEQLRQRIVMRNAQFGNPLTPDEVAEAQATT